MSLEEFIQACKTSPVLEISEVDITPELFQKVGLKTKIGGFYHRSQILELKNLLKERQVILRSNWLRR